jgi:thioredoxin:protein disulfide reductase
MEEIMYQYFRSGYVFVFATLALLTASIAAARDMPPAAKVFSLNATRNQDQTLVLHFGVMAGNYLYRDRIAATFNDQNLPLTLPEGDKKDDANFGLVTVFHKGFETSLPGMPKSGALSVKLQGCAEAGICYPPLTQSIDLATLSVTDTPPHTAFDDGAAFPPADFVPTATSGQPRAADVAITGNTITMLAGFLGFGLLLSFTPCVFPMIPILSAMLAQAGGRLTPARGFTLSTSYVLAMASAYGIVGLVAGWSGANLQATLQTSWALGLSAALFVVLALSMFGFYELQLPAGLGNRLSKGRGGSLAGAALLGFGSALIVGPCVTPPLAAAMLYSIQTGDAARGAAALFVLGLGMGLPLIAVGTFGAKILPKSGPWLATVRQAFGVVFLAIAVMLATRLLPGPAALALWGAFAIGMSVFLGAFDRLEGGGVHSKRLLKTAGLVTALYGAVLVVGAAGGGEDPLKPLAFVAPMSVAKAVRTETRVTTLAALDQALETSVANDKPVLISFSADWCTTCKTNEKLMEEPRFQSRMAKVPTINIDVTAQGADQGKLMSRFAVVGPPALILMDPKGTEIPDARIVGPVTPNDIIRILSMAGA